MNRVETENRYNNFIQWHSVSLHKYNTSKNYGEKKIKTITVWTQNAFTFSGQLKKKKTRTKQE